MSSSRVPRPHKAYLTTPLNPGTQDKKNGCKLGGPLDRCWTDPESVWFIHPYLMFTINARQTVLYIDGNEVLTNRLQSLGSR